MNLLSECRYLFTPSFLFCMNVSFQFLYSILCTNRLLLPSLSLLSPCFCFSLSLSSVSSPLQTLYVSAHSSQQPQPSALCAHFERARLFLLQPDWSKTLAGKMHRRERSQSQSNKADRRKKGRGNSWERERRRDGKRKKDKDKGSLRGKGRD